MGKRKYIKNSNGVTMSVTTDTLGLEKPLLNENYDIDVHNRNMDKIDEDLKPIDDSYIIELFQHDGDTTNPRDYYTKVEADEKFATKEEVENIDLSNLATKEEVNNALNKANEAFQRGDNVKTQLVDKLISEGLDVSTNNSFEELIGSIALGKKWSSGIVTITSTKKRFVGSWGSLNSDYYAEVRGLNFKPSCIVLYSEAKALRTIYNYGETYKSKQIVTTNMITWGGGSSHSLAYFTDSPCLIENGSFIVPVNSINVSAPFDMSWIAFE